MPAARMPAAEVPIDAALVRRLVDSQFPRWAGLDLEAVDSPGWDNALFRLGPELVVRLPRRQLGADLVPNEHRWLPQLAPLLPLPVPMPLGRGVPGSGYPWPWSICPWFPGRRASDVEFRDSERRDLASTLGRFLNALHAPAPPDAPDNPWRGVPLEARAEATDRYLASVSELSDAVALGALWQEALTVPPWEGPALWIHGDLHPANLIVDGNRLTAVVDFGDLTAGDRATDLSVAWMLFGPDERALFRQSVGADEATWARARGWAVSLTLAYLANSADNPVIEGIGRRAASAILAEAR
jgi:aminoglycoside phosphotransferase (APT) family kinase protein